MNMPLSKKHRWLYPLLYIAFGVISLLPLYTAKPYPPQATQSVMVEVLQVASTPYKALAPLLHLLTFGLIGLTLWRPEKMGRVWAVYLGLNYGLIAVTQSHGLTATYGFAVHTGGLILYIILGITWLVVARRNELQLPTRSELARAGWLLPLVVLALWAPYREVGAGVGPDFNPLLLLTSPDYGLTFCFTTPMFLFWLIQAYPRVNPVAYRITAFNGLLYGLLNMMHWFNPELRWMGFLHLPLLITSAYALVWPRLYQAKRTPDRQAQSKESAAVSLQS